MSRQTGVRTVKGNSLVTSSRFYSVSLVEKVASLLLLVFLFSLAKVRLTMVAGRAHKLRAYPSWMARIAHRVRVVATGTVGFRKGLVGKSHSLLPEPSREDACFQVAHHRQNHNWPRSQLAFPLGRSDSRPWVASTD